MEIKFNNPFTTGGNWYKGNLHTHTTQSDGPFSPAETVKQYKEAGYHFLSLTDHYRVTRVKDNRGLLLIAGEEIDCGIPQLARGFGYHIVALNIREEITIPKKGTKKTRPQEMISRIKSLGGEAVIAHPAFSNLTVNELLSLKDYFAIEVFNTCSFWVLDKGYAMDVWDKILIAGRNICGIAADDTHNPGNNYQPADIGGAWIMVKSENLTGQDIMNSIKKGLFYASRGPQIKDVKITDGVIRVKTSPVESISFIGLPTGGRRFNSLGKEPLEEISFRIDKEKCIRIQCADAHGRMAWTNAIFIK